MNIRIPLIAILLLAISAVGVTILIKEQSRPFKQVALNQSQHTWEMKSIDTMKYSRDKAKERLNDRSFDSIIEAQVKAISQTGATHIAIATPYDKEFLPYLTRWVAMARKYYLNVWFRGNFSGWEGWFGYPQTLSREEHLRMTREFISQNPTLFANHDAFTPCPECENGGPGDPRQTGEREGYRKFLIDEYNAANSEFAAIGKDVAVNYNSMNFDVAKIIMDKQTTASLGGIVAIDHYVDTPDSLVSSVRELARLSGGKIFLGEFGVPLPDINGDMNEDEQASWVEEALRKLIVEPSVMGVSYWVNTGGPTGLWNENGTPRKAAKILQSYFLPKVVSGTVSDQYNNPIPNVSVRSQYTQSLSDASGEFSISVLPFEKNISAQANGHQAITYAIPQNAEKLKIIIEKSPQSLIDYLKDLIYKNLK